MQRLLGSIGALGLSILALCFCALVGEGALRLTSQERSGAERQRFNAYRPSSTLSHELRPDSHVRFVFNDFDIQVRTNSLGFRGPDVTKEKAAGRARILVVGDSFAFGWGVEENEMFGNVLERRLADAGIPAEVINTGVPGYSTDQHLIFLRERGFAFDPDLVLIAICANDTPELAWKELRLDDARLPLSSASRRRFVNRRGEMRFLNARLYDLPKLPMPESLRGWLVDHSWAYGWLKIRSARAWASAMDRIESKRQELTEEEVPTGPIESLPPDVIERALRGSEAFRLRYHRFLMDAIQADADRRGVPLRTVLLQDAEAGLRSDCRRSHCLDLSEVFLRENEPDAYLAKDGHWSALGHQKAGDSIAAWLLADRDLSLQAL